MADYIDATKIVDHFQRQLSMIRTGVVNSSLLDHVLIDMYGTKMTIVELATINKPEPTQLLITPYDKSANTAIAKAIQESHLGVNPVDDGAGIRLLFPPMTEENRKNRLKEVAAELETAKITVRNARQDALKSVKAQKEAGDVSEDEMKAAEKVIQTEVDAVNTQLADFAATKEKELMTL